MLYANKFRVKMTKSDIEHDILFTINERTDILNVQITDFKHKRWPQTNSETKFV